MNNKLLQQAKYLILFLSAIAILSYAPVFASSPAPAPLCQITGVIKSFNFKEAYDEPCLKEPYGCPTDTELHHPARYYLDVSINSVAYISGETNFNTCDNMYPVGSIKNIFIGKDKVKVGDTFSVNQKIEGVVRSFWGSSFDSYNLKIEKPQLVKQIISGKVVNGGDTTPEGLYDAPSTFIYQVKQDNGAIVKVTYTTYPPSPVGDRERKKIRLSFYAASSVNAGDHLKAYGSFDKNTQTLTVADEGDYIETSAGSKLPIDQKNGDEQNPKSILETSKISEKLIGENYVDQVNNISLQTDQQTYKVTASKSGKLFLFIPVHLSVQITVDAASGEVRKMKKPWWAFLVRYNADSSSCALETCHGLDIKCGANPPGACTMMYGIGDKCLQFANCGRVNGKCQQIQNQKFSECKSCVEKCIAGNQNDLPKMFKCESECN